LGAASQFESGTTTTTASDSAARDSVNVTELGLDSLTADLSEDLNELWQPSEQLTPSSTAVTTTGVISPFNPSSLDSFLQSPVSSSASTSIPTGPIDLSSSAYPISLDSYLLATSGEATTLRAFLRIAARMNCADELWDLTALSPFFTGKSTGTLPKAWQPTPNQILLAHHPLLDFLPWPSAREKILAMFSLDDSAKPDHAKGQLGFVSFAYDVEDAHEGLRVWGSDPCVPEAWEIGQLLFERWWFIFDQEIIEQSNRWRRARGSPPLKISGLWHPSAPSAKSVVDEV